MAMGLVMAEEEAEEVVEEDEVVIEVEEEVEEEDEEAGVVVVIEAKAGIDYKKCIVKIHLVTMYCLALIEGLRNTP